MAKKSVLEAAYHACGNRSHLARRAAASHDYPQALALAVGCLPQLRDALNYQRRYLKPTQVSFPPVRLILQHAPPTFANMALDELAGWVGRLSRVERAAVPELPERLVAARRMLDRAVRLWSDLSRFDAERRWQVGLVGTWQAAGFIAAGVDGAYRRVTELGRPVAGKCPGCGRVHEAPFVTLLDPLVCPGCKQPSMFVLVRRLG